MSAPPLPLVEHAVLRKFSFDRLQIQKVARRHPISPDLSALQYRSVLHFPISSVG